jgi:translation initiation factor IF-1
MKKGKNKLKIMKKKKNGRNGQSMLEEKMVEDKKMELNGVVKEALPGTLFEIISEANTKILATLSGKLRQNQIRILPGDEVIVEVSPYDPSRGRISRRK